MLDERKKKNEVFIFLRNILLIFIDILETQTSFIIPNFCYCTIIGIYFLQIIANILDFSDSENITIRYLTSFSQSSTLTYFLLDSSSYYRTWISYIISHTLLYFLWIFIVYSAYNKKNNPIKFQEKTPFEVMLKEILRTYITAYFYFFYEPYNKINLGIMIRGDKCLLPFEQDSKDQLHTNGYALVLGFMGCITNILMTSLTMYFFRNFEFHDTNAFKRKHSTILYLILVIRFLISLMFTISQGTVGILHFLCHLLGFTVIYDALFIRPFLNQKVCRFYIIAAMMYELGCICITFMKFTDFFGPLNLLYTYLWLGPMVGYIAVLLSERFYHRSLYIMPNTIEQQMEIFDLYTEEVIRLYKDSYFSDESKFLILSLFRFHIIDCMSPDCFCLKYGSDNLEKKHAKDMFAAIYVYTEINKRVLKNITLSMPQLIKIVDSMFKIALDKPKILENSNHYENISLKYISFINKYMENSLLSYFFLKKLGKNQQQLSYFFSLLFEIYSDKLKQQMRQMNESMASKSSTNLDNNLNFIETIQQVEEFTQQFTSQILEIINLKSKIWDIFYKGANTMDELFSHVKQKLNIILQIKSNLIWQFKSSFLLSSQAILLQNAAYIKLHQVFELFIMNDTLKVRKMESKIIDQRKRDQYKEEIFLNNYNYMAGSSVTIKAGLSLENGKILNRNNTKIAEFFGFSAHEMDQIRTINDVMPRHISVLHNQILAQYLTKGYSSLMTTSRKIFLINKEKFLFPCSIQVRNDFTNLSDCVFNATLLKTQANRELVMFDEFGRVLSITKNFFNAISRNRQTHATLFTYEQMREKCLLFLLCPTLAKIFQSNLPMMKEAESQDDVVCIPISNLLCSLFTSSDMIDFSNTYKNQLRSVGNSSGNQSQINKARSLQEKESGRTQNSNMNQSEAGGSGKTSSLVDEVDLVNIKTFIQENKDKYRYGSNIQRFKMRFTLHFFFRNFANVDRRVLKSIVGSAKQIKEYLCMRYFVIECQEINKTKIVPTNGQFETLRTTLQTNMSMSKQNSPQPQDAESQDSSSSESSSPLEQKQSQKQESDNPNDISIHFDNDSISEGKIKLNINTHDLQNNDSQLIQNMSQISLKEQNNYGILEQNVFSQINSPKGAENQPINQFQIDIDVRKQNMIQRMLQFENKWENKPQIVDIEPQAPKQVEKQISEKVSNKIIEAPLIVTNIVSINENKINYETVYGEIDDIVEHDDNKEDQVKSFNEESDEEIDEIEDFQVADFKKKVLEDAEIRNEKRVKFDMDCSSQSSRFSTSGGQNVNDIYLNHKMPSQYRKFLFTIAIFLTTIMASMIAMVSISSIGFSRFDFFNEFIETSYLLHSHFTEAILGTYYLKMTEFNIIPPVPYLNSKTLFEFNIAHSQQTMVEDFQQHFQMVQGSNSVISSVKTPLFTTNDTLIYLDLDLISYCNNQIELFKSLPQNMLSLRSLILRISTNLELTGIINEKIASDLIKIENDLVNNIFLIFYISCIILSFQTFQMGMAYKNFIEFQEKVLLLVTRVNLAEYEQEIAKLKYAKDIVKNMDGSQVVTQDFLPNLIYFNLSKNQKDEENQMEMAQQSNEVKQKKKSNHQSKGNTLSSKIYNPKLSIKFPFIKLTFILQITVLYLVGGLLLALNVPSLYNDQSELTIETLNGFSQFQTLNLYSLLLASGNVFGEQVYGMAPSSTQVMDLNRSEVYADYQRLKLLENEFLTRQSRYAYFYQSSSNDMSNILFQDLCLMPLQGDIPKQICSSPLSIFYKKGLQGLQIQSNSFMDSYDILIREGGTQETVTKYLQQDDYWALQTTFFVFMQEYMLRMNLIIYNIIKVALYFSKNELVILTLRLKDNIQMYMIITGISLGILLASYFYKSIIGLLVIIIVLVLNRNIECVEYLLCFIPTSKLSEPATIQMIKAIQNF